MKKVLILEDEVNIRSFVVINLTRAGYTAIEAGTGREALDRLRENPDIGVAILDIMLPDMDGFEVCRNIRAGNKQIGIIMLTARTQNEDIVRGLEAGADDYVTKPFDRQVLLARIAAVLRRGTTVAQTDFDGLVVDGEAHVAKLNGEDLALAPGELKILALLVANRGRVLARSRILDHVQSEERSVTERTVDVQIANLRRKLGDWSDHVETIRGVGYRVRG